jgi:hypothetical protein
MPVRAVSECNTPTCPIHAFRQRHLPITTTTFLGELGLYSMDDIEKVRKRNLMPAPQTRQHALSRNVPRGLLETELSVRFGVVSRCNGAGPWRGREAVRT